MTVCDGSGDEAELDIILIYQIFTAAGVFTYTTIQDVTIL